MYLYSAKLQVTTLMMNSSTIHHEHKSGDQIEDCILKVSVNEETLYQEPEPSRFTKPNVGLNLHSVYTYE